MKKILIALFVLVSFTALAQKTNSYQPYVNGGVSISNNTLSYGTEVGEANLNTRYAVGVTSTTARPDNVWSLYTKGYWKISKRSVQEKVNVYASGAVNLGLTRTHALSIEPGLAAIFNLAPRLSPQISVGFPIQQNSVFRNRPLAVNAGISLNYSL